MDDINKDTQADINNSVNIRRFTLAADVKENGPEVAALRAYVRGGDISLIQEYLDNGTIIEISEQHNLICDAGFAQQEMGMTYERTTAPAITYGLLGTGANPVPAANSTQLVTEVFRKVAASRSHVGKTVYVDFFFTAADCNGTYTEFGNVIDGSGSANTGSLFSYIATGGWVKTGSQSLYVSCQYNIANA